MKLTTWSADIERAIASGSSDDMAEMLRRVNQEIDALRKAERGDPDKLGFRDYIRVHFASVLEEAGLTSGKVAEIGGAHNSFKDEMPDYDFEFLSIYPDPDFPEVHVADITYCPQIPDESFDAVFSVSVMEHVARPWAAGREIRRILKPGGIAYHAAPFSYFFHGAPMDFWRYTPEALKALFPDFECLHASFYSGNRRRNNTGSDFNPVDRDGGPQFSVDAFGGWRENWFALYAGQKTDEAAAELRRRRLQQLAVDTVAMLEEDGATEPEIYEKASEIVATVGFDAEGDIRRRPTPAENRMAPERIRSVWRRKRQLGVPPSPMRAALRAILAE